MISGPNIIVEIDETKIGKRKYHRGYRVDGMWVIGEVERTEEKNISLNQYLTEQLKYYLRIEVLDVSHNEVNYSQGFINHETGTHTNTIEGLWNGLKLRVPPCNKTKDKITNHLHEFIWRRHIEIIYG
ncbi:22265_t:CDS:2, partial [Dentiscutata erythropus]